MIKHLQLDKQQSPLPNNRSIYRSEGTTSGFTIVELLVVIVVIGILAAITIVAYNGIQQRANLSALKIDMSSAAKTLELANTSGGTYPATLTIAALKASPGTTYQYTYTSSGNTYCLTGTNNGVAYTASTSSPTPAVGVCPGHTPPVVLVNGGVVTTLAGSGVAALADGTGTSAQFFNPIGMAVDGSGTVYVADTNSIHKVTPSGVATTLAGSATYGFVDGTGTSAQFAYPRGVAVDASATVFVADWGNNRIRKITSSGVVTTLAGSGAIGSADGTGISAQFSNPFGIAIDTSGTLYIADQGNYRIRKITSSGVVTTLAGSGVAGFADGTGTSAQFYNPTGIAVDASGTIYVADRDNSRIRKVTTGGVVTTLAGSGVAGFADGTGTSAQFINPIGIAVDASGNVYVGDVNNNRIRKVTSGGAVTTLAGATQGFADGTGSSAQFYNPYGIAVDTSGTVYVGDTNNNRIRKIQ